MADISKIRDLKNERIYNIADAQARSDLNTKVNKSGDTMTGRLTIEGTANSSPLLVRGIQGSNGSTTSSDLYLNYADGGKVYFGLGGGGNISSDGTLYSGKAENVTGTIAIANGGTSATTAANARINLEITPANIGAAALNHTHNYLSTSNGGIVEDTLILSKIQDASGIADNRPALIIGGQPSGLHIEIDGNEIMAKANATTTSTLYINSDGGPVYIGNGGLNLTKPLSIESGGTNANTSKSARNNLGVLYTYPSKNIYVSTTGNDSTGDGSQSKPYKTIQKAINESPYLQSNTYIYIEPGTYNERVVTNSYQYIYLVNTETNDVIITSNASDALVVNSLSKLILRGKFEIKAQSNSRYAICVYQDGVLTYYTQNSGDRLKVTQPSSGNFGLYSEGFVYIRADFNLNCSGPGIANVYGEMNIYNFTGSVSTTLLTCHYGKISYSFNNSTYGTLALTNHGGRIYTGSQTSVAKY